MRSIQNWHQRYTQQARWTYPLRQYLYRQVKLQNARRVLDLGCGTGALLPELLTATHAEIFGLDIDPQALWLASKNSGQANLILGDGHTLPCLNSCFDVVLCHFVLLWTGNPTQVVKEMKRVARPGGAILAIAEPDYPGRIDFPPNLEILGRLQAEALRRQGADPSLGRRLAGLFSQAGLIDIEVGVLGGQWTLPVPEQDWNSEWDVLRADLEGLITPEEIAEFQTADESARRLGQRILYVPTFYAWGHNPR